MSLTRNVIKKSWGGYEWHPFLEMLRIELSSKGYTCDGIDKGLDSSGSCTFSRELFLGHSAEITLIPQPHRQAKDRFGFTVILFVNSLRQMEIYNQLRLWECFNRFPGQEDRPLAAAQEPICLISKQLSWLMTHMEPMVPAEAIFNRWVDIDNDAFQAVADDLLFYLARQGEEFFEHLNSPEKLAATLSGSKGNVFAISSINRHEFAAVVMYDLGRTQEAIIELNKHLKVFEAKKHEDDVALIAYDIQKEIVDRYACWFYSKN